MATSGAAQLLPAAAAVHHNSVMWLPPLKQGPATASTTNDSSAVTIPPLFYLKPIDVYRQGRATVLETSATSSSGSSRGFTDPIARLLEGQHVDEELRNCIRYLCFSAPPEPAPAAFTAVLEAVFGCSNHQRPSRAALVSCRDVILSLPEADHHQSDAHHAIFAAYELAAVGCVKADGRLPVGLYVGLRRLAMLLHWDIPTAMQLLDQAARCVLSVEEENNPIGGQVQDASAPPGASSGKDTIFTRKNVVRAAKIGAFGVLGGAVFAITGGLAAPAIATAVATIGGATSAATAAAGAATAASAASVGTAQAVAVLSAGKVAIAMGVGGTGYSSLRGFRRTQGASDYRFRSIAHEGDATAWLNAPLRRTAGWVSVSAPSPLRPRTIGQSFALAGFQPPSASEAASSQSAAPTEADSRNQGQVEDTQMTAADPATGDFVLVNSVSDISCSVGREYPTSDRAPTQSLVCSVLQRHVALRHIEAIRKETRALTFSIEMAMATHGRDIALCVSGAWSTVGEWAIAPPEWIVNGAIGVGCTRSEAFVPQPLEVILRLTLCRVQGLGYASEDHEDRTGDVVVEELSSVYVKLNNGMVNRNYGVADGHNDELNNGPLDAIPFHMFDVSASQPTGREHPTGLVSAVCAVNLIGDSFVVSVRSPRPAWAARSYALPLVLSHIEVLHPSALDAKASLGVAGWSDPIMGAVEWELRTVKGSLIPEHNGGATETSSEASGAPPALLPVLFSTSSEHNAAWFALIKAASADESGLRRIVAPRPPHASVVLKVNPSREATGGPTDPIFIAIDFSTKHGIGVAIFFEDPLSQRTMATGSSQWDTVVKPRLVYGADVASESAAAAATWLTDLLTEDAVSRRRRATDDHQSTCLWRPLTSVAVGPRFHVEVHLGRIPDDPVGVSADGKATSSSQRPLVAVRLRSENRVVDPKSDSALSSTGPRLVLCLSGLTTATDFAYDSSGQSAAQWRIAFHGAASSSVRTADHDSSPPILQESAVGCEWMNISGWDDGQLDRWTSLIGAQFLARTENLASNKAKSFVKSSVKSAIKDQLIKRGGMIAAGTAAAFAVMSLWAVPATAKSIVSLIDNAYASLRHRAEDMGRRLSEEIRKTNRPVSLFGYGFGAAVIMSCLRHLSTTDKVSSASSKQEPSPDDQTVPSPVDILDSVIVMGLPIAVASSEWQAARRVAKGRLIHVFSRQDLLLSLLHSANDPAALASDAVAAGLEPVWEDGVESVDASSVVAQHGDYCARLGLILSLIPPHSVSLRSTARSAAEGSAATVCHCFGAVVPTSFVRSVSGQMARSTASIAFEFSPVAAVTNVVAQRPPREAVILVAFSHGSRARKGVRQTVILTASEKRSPKWLWDFEPPSTSSLEIPPGSTALFSAFTTGKEDDAESKDVAEGPSTHEENTVVDAEFGSQLESRSSQPSSSSSNASGSPAVLSFYIDLRVVQEADVSSSTAPSQQKPRFEMLKLRLDISVSETSLGLQPRVNIHILSAGGAPDGESAARERLASMRRELKVKYLQDDKVWRVTWQVDPAQLLLSF